MIRAHLLDDNAGLRSGREAQRLIDGSPVRRKGQTDEVASNAASYICGFLLGVNGGLQMT